MMKSIAVNVSKKYEVLIGSGFLHKAGGIIKESVKGSRAAIVTDDIVGPLYAEKLEESLRASGYTVSRYTIENGEKSKNTLNFVELLNFLAKNNITRSDAVIALGGGVVGDLAGFAAATFMRGVRFVQIPTTLLAAVDSSVGGKVGIDLETGKNLAGAVYQPEVVLCDVSLLDTLPGNVFADGCAEVIKYGVIADRALFDLLKEPIRDNLEAVITRCVEIKRDTVEADEFEVGERKLLNFGHTIGHAIERCHSFTVSHGTAVAMGMAVITRAAERSGLCAKGCYDEIVEMLKRYELPWSTDIKASTLSYYAGMDKKRSGSTITLALPERIGKCFLHEMEMSELEAFIELGVFK